MANVFSKSDNFIAKFVQKIFATTFILTMFAPLVLNVFAIPAITHAIVPFDNNIFVFKILTYIIIICSHLKSGLHETIVANQHKHLIVNRDEHTLCYLE